MEKYTQKWAVVCFFDRISDSFEFDASDNPLHATIAGVFLLDMNGDRILKLIEKFVVLNEKLIIEGVQIVSWGEGLKVTLIKESKNFDELYRDIQVGLVNNGAVFNEPQYLLDGFTPHVTVQKAIQLNPEQKLEVRSISLIDMYPNKDGTKRRVLGSIPLL